MSVTGVCLQLSVGTVLFIFFGNQTNAGVLSGSQWVYEGGPPVTLDALSIKVTVLTS